MKNRGITLAVNASGAAMAGTYGNVVVIVDVIDMSTTLEAAIEAGAVCVYGASPSEVNATVSLDPEGIGRQAGLTAKSLNAGIIIVSEPRIGNTEERILRSRRVITGVEQTGAEIEAIYPNLGKDTIKLGQFWDRVVIAITDTGGVAFDAAVKAGAPQVLTGTVARTMGMKGSEPARAAANRAIRAATKHNAGIAVIAASHNSLEDILAAEYIVKVIIEEGFTAGLPV